MGGWVSPVQLLLMVVMRRGSRRVGRRYSAQKPGRRGRWVGGRREGLVVVEGRVGPVLVVPVVVGRRWVGGGMEVGVVGVGVGRGDGGEGAPSHQVVGGLLGVGGWVVEPPVLVVLVLVLVRGWVVVVGGGGGSGGGRRRRHGCVEGEGGVVG